MLEIDYNAQRLSIVQGGRYDGAEARSARRFATLALATMSVPAAMIPMLFAPAIAGESLAFGLAAATSVSCLGSAGLLARLRGPRGFTELRAIGYVLIVLIALLQYAYGGWSAPIYVMFAPIALLSSCIHPAHYSVPQSLFALAMTMTPLAYGYDRPQLLSVLAFAVLWTATCAFSGSLVWSLRRQRKLLASRHAVAADRALRDQLTGLGNRRAFEEALIRALSRTRSTGRPLTLAVGDVDDFKLINDELGHLAGDRALADIGVALVAETRDIDQVFRWGGDEFVVVLEDVDGAAAAHARERLERAISTGVMVEGIGEVRMTFGLAADDGLVTPSELLDRADEQLLARKRVRERRR